MRESAQGSRRRLLLVLTLLGVALTLGLAWWQLGRAAQKRQLGADIAARALAPALSNGDLLAGGPGLEHRLVTLTGHWLSGRTVYLDNRSMDGRAGFFVLTPLQLQDRSEAVLVQRGWVPRDPADRQRLPALADPQGLRQVRGRLALTPSRMFELGRAEPGPIRQNLDPAAYAAETGLTLLPLAVVQQDDAQAEPGLLRHWPAPTVDIHKHYGYAAQWLGLAALQIGLYVWFQIIRPRRQR